MEGVNLRSKEGLGVSGSEANKHTEKGILCKEKLIRGNKKDIPLFCYSWRGY